MESLGVIFLFGRLFEIAGVFVMVLGAIAATSVLLSSWLSEWDFKSSYFEYRQNLGRSLLLGLDFLIVGDIINSILIAASFSNVGILAVIIAIRSFLSAELEHRISGYWPWQIRHKERV